MTDPNDQWPSVQDATADLPSSKDHLNPRGVRILYCTGLLMLVAWVIYIAWKQPQSRTSILLQGLLFLLLVVHNRNTKRKRDALAARFSKPGMRRTLAALLPVLVLALVGLSQLMEARQREAERQLAQKTEAWSQSVERQRSIVAQAQKRINESLEKGKEATKALNNAFVKVKTADGRTELRAPPAAMQKWQEAWDESLRALDLSRVENEHLLHLQSDRPKR
jgi:Flp pilus assembly protein TadB